MTTWGAPACFAATAASNAALPPPITTTGTVSVLIIHAYLGKIQNPNLAIQQASHPNQELRLLLQSGDLKFS
jgi:hypothetical protein